MNTKKLAVVLIGVFALAVVFVCMLFFSHPKSIPVSLDKEFKLEVNQSAVLRGRNNFKVKLTKIENSVCENNDCEDGTLIYSFLINNNVQEMDNEENKSIEVGNYTLTLSNGDAKEVTLMVSEEGSVNDMFE